MVAVALGRFQLAQVVFGLLKQVQMLMEKQAGMGKDIHSIRGIMEITRLVVQVTMDKRGSQVEQKEVAAAAVDTKVGVQ